MKNLSDDNSGKPNGALDQEGQSPKLKYPRSIAFIIGNEFCERFNYYGLRTILVIYLNSQLLYSKDDSTVIYHAFAMLVYFMCIFGAIVADSWLGKFRTILYVSMIYVVGSVLISVAAIPPLKLPAIPLTLLGLFLIAVGSGGIKPCVSAFGGDQFKLPEQAKQMATFFSLFYFAINSGSLISTTVTPILRHDVHCFGDLSCFSLAFGVPAVLMIVSIVIFFIGRPLYISKPAEGNMFVKVSKAIGTAIATRCKESKYNPQPHWLDYATKTYGWQLIEDIKVLLRVLVLYIPLPVFWALFDQQGSRWTFQATRMDGRLGTIEIKPEQLQLLNPFLILVFIPLFDVAFYPLLAKIGIKRPLQKLTIGGILAGVAFLVSAGVELELEKTYPVLPSADISQIRIFNGVSGCDFRIKSDLPNWSEFTVKSTDYFEEKFVKVDKTTSFDYKLSPTGENAANCLSFEGKFLLEEKKAISYFIYEEEKKLKTLRFPDYVDKPEKGNPEVRILASFPQPTFVKLQEGEKTPILFNDTHPNTKRMEVVAATYKVIAADKEVFSTEIVQGGEYTILLSQDSSNKIKSKVITITEPNSFNMLWLIPQYFIMTLGEVMFSVTGLEFSYSQAPLCMKSVLQACWLLTTALGNLIVIIIAKTSLFSSQAYEFFLFAGLMFVDMGFFMILARRYKPNNPNETQDDLIKARKSSVQAEALSD